MSFEARYPDTGGSTLSWLPASSPSRDGSSRPLHSGYDLQAASDQLTLYAHQFSGPWREYTMPFVLTTEEMDDLEDFVLTVGGGSFYIRETCADMLPAYTKVKLTANGHELAREPRPGGKWFTVLRVRDSN